MSIDHLKNISPTAKFSFLIFLLFCCPTLVFGQEGEFDLQSSIEYAFGQELRFSIDLQNAAKIEKITLSIRPELASNVYVKNVPFEPGETISVTHSISVNEINLKPYSQVNYFWEIQTNEGKFKIPQESFAYDDDRFEWQRMTQDGITAYWTGAGPFLGQDVLTIVNEALAKLANLLPLEQISPFSIYVYPSSADLRAGLRLADLEDDSTSHPELGVILVTAVNPQSAVADLSQSVPYELSQLLLYRATANDFNNLPWWITEGLSTIVQTQTNPRYAQLLEEAINSSDTIPVQQLCRKTERVGERALLASAQSNSFVNYVLQRFGEEALRDLVSAYVLGDECETGVSRALGISLLELEEGWLDAQQQPSIFSPTPLNRSGKFSTFGTMETGLISLSGIMPVLPRTSCS